MPMFKRGCVVLLLILASACGNSSPSAPSPATVAGNWSGMYQGVQLGLPLHDAIVMNLTQAGSSVNGTWTITNPQASNGYSAAGGTVSGTTTANSFSGTLTINGTTNSGAACSGTFAVSGNAGGTTMTWTSPVRPAVAPTCRDPSQSPCRTNCALTLVDSRRRGANMAVCSLQAANSDRR
jgi:hypothetical protein